MSISFENALGIHESAVRVRTQRAAVLANNLANIDTPNFKARDLDFKQRLNQTLDGNHLKTQTTNERHLSADNVIEDSAELLYRTPQQPSIDGNTVEDQIEHVEYMKNTMEFQASLHFLNGSFKGLKSALRGD